MPDSLVLILLSLSTLVVGFFLGIRFGKRRGVEDKIGTRIEDLHFLVYFHLYLTKLRTNMHIKLLKRLLAAVAMITLFTAAMTTSDDLVGTWKYKAPTAPYEYSTGEIVVTDDSGTLVILFNTNGTEYKTNNISHSNGQLKFEAYVEGESVSFDLTIAGDNMRGSAMYSEGTVELTADRD